jgi:hypothetical protein
VISDCGPYESHPDDNQPGHAKDCLRLATELTRWRSSPQGDDVAHMPSAPRAAERSVAGAATAAAQEATPRCSPQHRGPNSWRCPTANDGRHYQTGLWRTLAGTAKPTTGTKLPPVAAGAASHVAQIVRWSPTPLAQAACPDDRAIDRGTERLLCTEYAC